MQALLITEETTYEEVVLWGSEALASLPPVSETDGPIRKTYDYEPGQFLDLWPCLAVHHSSDARTVGASDEIQMPNLFVFNIRAYYPVFDVGEEDGLKVAQRQSLRAMSAFLGALWKDPQLEYNVVYSNREAGRTIGFPEPSLNLYGYESQVNLITH